MWSLIKTLLSGLLSLILKRKAEKTIEVRKYDKYEEWEKEETRLWKELVKVKLELRGLSTEVVQAAENHDNNAMLDAGRERDKLQRKRNRLQQQYDEHCRRKPS